MIFNKPFFDFTPFPVDLLSANKNKFNNSCKGNVSGLLETEFFNDNQ